MEFNDQQLVQNFLTGDDAAFEELVGRYLKPVYNFLYQLTNDPSAVDDLTQVTFVKVWKNIRRFDQKKSFKVWIFAIAKNTAYDYFKKKKTLPFALFEREDGSNKLEEISEEAVLPDELLMQADSAKELEEKLNQLAPRYKLILLMRYRDDLSLAEIAEILNLSYNTIKSQHQRALSGLKKLYR